MTTTVNELQKKYPTVPKDIILKWEMMVRGVKDNMDIDKVSEWVPASAGSYQSYDAELTQKRIAEETPWRIKDNMMLRPENMLMKSGTGFMLYRQWQSPYTVREISEDKFAIFEGEEQVDVDVFRAPQRKKRDRGQQVSSKGTPLGDLVRLNKRCFSVIPVRFCEYFVKNEECKFCNFNPTQEDSKAAGLYRPVTVNPVEVGEAFHVYSREVRLIEGCLESGGFFTTDAEANVTLKYVENITRNVPYEIHLKTISEAMERKQYQRLKEAGLKGVRMQMEIFDERLFPIVVPGKSNHLSRDGWLESFQDAVDVFGIGNVACKIVGGVGIQGPEGYPTWQEARDSHIEGDRWMISHGVLPAFQALRWAPGSPYSRDPANRAKYPPTDYYLDVAVAHDKAMKEYGMYEKINRFLYCGLDCQTNPYVGEIGVVQKWGDYGKFMEEVLPYEQNWLTQYLEDKRDPVTVR